MIKIKKNDTSSKHSIGKAYSLRPPHNGGSGSKGGSIGNKSGSIGNKGGKEK